MFSDSDRLRSARCAADKWRRSPQGQPRPALAQRLHGAKEPPGRFERIEGLEHVDKVVDVNQAPIGRTPRSNPATYTGVLDGIRKLFAQVPEARVRGYGPGRFSFNVKGGRCEAAGQVTEKRKLDPADGVFRRYRGDQRDCGARGCP